MRHLAPLVRFLLALAITAPPALAVAAPESTDPTEVEGVDAAATRRPRRAPLTAPKPSAAADAGLTPAWTFGLSLPITRFGFTRNDDGSYGGHVTPLQAGVGTSIYWNAIRTANGTVPVSLGAMLFGATDVGSTQSDAGLGVAIGPSFWNNTFGLMVGVDLYRRIGSQDTGVLMASAGGANGFERQNVFVLFNFGIGLGKSAPGALKIAP